MLDKETYTREEVEALTASSRDDSFELKYGLGFLIFILCLAVLDVMTNGVGCS